MASIYRNISGALTTQLIKPGSNAQVSSIWLTNIHASDAVTVDLYLEKKLKGKFLLSINDSAEIRETFKDFRIIGLSVQGAGREGSDIGTKVRKELFIKNY